MKEYLAEGKVSLYLHIPFCTTKCGYCAFYSLPKKACKGDDMERFYKTLSCQLQALVEELDTPFHTIYIGGGNPGLLGVDRLHSFLSLASSKGRAEEVSMEINPETLDESFFQLKDYLTRLSIGIQSFNETHLKTLERNATLKDNIRALEMAAKHSIIFNADLITNIPRQSLDEAKEDINILSSFAPHHISLYSLTFEEGSRLIEKERPKSEDEEEEFLTSLWDLLEEKGYEQYEVSAFARDGHYCRHNLVYWNLGQYIGLGPSAESSVGYKNIISSREAETLDEYLKNPSFVSERLTQTEGIEEYLIATLRTKWGVNKSEFMRRFGLEFDGTFASAIEGLDKRWFNNSKTAFILTREGIMVLNRILLSLCMVL